jgi:ABC-type branched-subunit amino acid transport system ATPase component/ABC-type branched-subunit amino acid transport system permease subunit
VTGPTPVVAVSLAGWDVSIETLVIGLLTGLTYAVLAAGLVLVFRATRVINFAHGEIGAFGAAVLAKLVIDQRWNFFVALPLVLALGGVVGAAVELGVIRRLFKAPRAIVLVATIGVSQLLFVAQLLLPQVREPGRYPSPFERVLQVGDTLRLSSEHFMVIAFAPAIIAGLALFLGRTPHGLAIRAAADNPDRAELSGISAKRVSTLVWVLAGVLSTVTAVLVNPLRGTIVGVPSQALGPSLLLRALAAGLFGRLVSVPAALVGGVAIGVVEAILFVNVRQPGVVDAVLFGAVLVLVLVRARRDGSDEGGWSLTPRVASIPERLQRVWWVRRMGPLSATAGVALAVVLPLVITSASRNYLFTRVVLYAIIGLSVTVLSGWAGQLSLGQFAFVGLGAMTTASLVGRGMGFPVAVGYATVAGVFVAIMVGFPALRVRGLFLSVTTLAFAVAASNWLFNVDLLTNGQGTSTVPRAALFGIDLAPERTYYYMCLAVLIACAAMVGRLRTTGIGRCLIAVRENEAAASAFAVSPAVAKMTAFALGGGLAALAGSLLAGLEINIGSNYFGPQLSLQVVAMVVIGGLGSVTGAILGAVYVVGLPALWDGSLTVGLLTSGIGLLVLLLYLPGGLIEVVHRGRDALLALASPRAPTGSPQADPVATRTLPARPAAGDNDVSPPARGASPLSVSVGGRLVLDSVSVTAHRGEVVGLIGSNGAGKSTLLNVISGFVPVVDGRVVLLGTDVTAYPAHARAARGLGRVFQDARLFADLTVRETVKVALEAHERSELVPALLALPPSRRAERRKSEDAEAIVGFLGLGRYADTFVGNLSTGTRRIVELACLLAQHASVLLLDEPTAGVAQRETEAFGPLIKRIQSELGATIVLIEHDIPLVMSISDRVYCLAAGRCIAEGLPPEVRNDPAVVAAYLGTDERAIARSGRAAVTPAANPT